VSRHVDGVIPRPQGKYTCLFLCRLDIDSTKITFVSDNGDVFCI